jgi:Cu/Ag efflux protein CusF
MRRTTGDQTPAFFVLLLLFACSGGERDISESSTQEKESGASLTRTFRVRGVIRQLPQADEAGTPLLVHHEAISDFVGLSGDVEPMAAMTMAFPIGSEVSLEGLAPGDKIVFDLEVDWSAATPAQITALDKIPPDTVLEF